MEEKIIIAGPCAAENEEQVLTVAEHLKKFKNVWMRASLWKPRTKPGFDGVGKKGIPWLAKITKMGIVVGTEVLLPEHVSEVLNGIEKEGGNLKNLFFWIGARNQNHFLQRKIAQRLKKAPKQIKLLIKNQPWPDINHWLGIIEHVSKELEKERIILCHRGFAPNGQENSLNFRNLPDFELAIEVKRKTNLPMILDPSHIAGNSELVFKVIEMAINYDFDGLMVEIHPHPQSAKTDSQQQLNLKEFCQIFSLYSK